MNEYSELIKNAKASATILELMFFDSSGLSVPAKELRDLCDAVDALQQRVGELEKERDEQDDYLLLANSFMAERNALRDKLTEVASAGDALVVHAVARWQAVAVASRWKEITEDIPR